MRLALPTSVVFLAALLLHCARSHHAPPLAGELSSITPDESESRFIEDRDDRCRSLPDDCFTDNDGGEDDGCPDPPVPKVNFERGHAVVEQDKILLNGIALDAERWKPGVVLQLAAESAPDEATELGALRMAAVRAYLIEAGVPATKLQLHRQAPGEPEGINSNPCACVRLQPVGCEGDT